MSGVCTKCGKPLKDRSDAPPHDPASEYNWVMVDIRDDTGVYHDFCWGAYGDRIRRERDNALVARIG